MLLLKLGSVVASGVLGILAPLVDPKQQCARCSCFILREVLVSYSLF